MSSNIEELVLASCDQSFIFKREVGKSQFLNLQSLWKQENNVNSPSLNGCIRNEAGSEYIYRG
jgi:hypothetical protein